MAESGVAAALGLAGEEAAKSPVNYAIGSAVKHVRKGVANQYKDRYDEELVRGVVLNQLQRLADNVKALRNQEFETAQNMLRSWIASTEEMESENQMNTLENVKTYAATAFVKVEDYTDKITALHFFLFATYHLTAFRNKEKDCEEPNWKKGKEEARTQLKTYVDGESMKWLVDAAKAEIYGRAPWFSAMRRNELRWDILQEFINLDYYLFHLPPAGYANPVVGFPKSYQQIKDAVLEAAGQRRHCWIPNEKMISAKIGHIISEPTERYHDFTESRDYCCCAFYAKEPKVVFGSDNYCLKILNLSNGKVEVLLVKQHDKETSCRAVFLNDTRLISGFEDGVLEVVDLESGQQLRKLKGHEEEIKCCVANADGTRAISGSFDGTLVFWNLESGEKIQALNASDGRRWNFHCEFISDAKAIVSCDDGLHIWDLENNEKEQCVSEQSGIFCCAVYDHSVVYGTGEGALCLLNLNHENGTIETIPPTEFCDPISCCRVFADKTRAVSGHDDGTLTIWDLIKRQVICTLEVSNLGSVVSCAILENDTRVVACSCQTKNPNMDPWDLEGTYMTSDIDLWELPYE